MTVSRDMTRPVGERATAYHFGARRLLVVDNDPTMLRVVERIRPSGFDLHTCGGGKEALALIATARFDVILCDVLMPGLDGQEFYREALKIDAGSAAGRIVFMTGAASVPHIRTFLASLPNVCLEKPFTRRELQRAVDGVDAHGAVA